MKKAIQLLGGLSAVCLLGLTSMSAQAAAPEEKGWETSANAGLTLTRGNSRTVLTTIGLDSARKWDADEALLGVAGGYGRSSGVRNTDYVKAYGQYNHLINERAYFGLRLDGEHDGIADLVYRARISPLLGYYVIKNETTSLSFEAGPSLVIERYEGPTASTDSYLAARFGERFEHQLTDSTRIWQSLEYVPKVDDWANKYLINGEVGISTAISPKWDLRVVLQVAHDSEPIAGRKNTDTRLIAGTGYKF